MSLTPHTSAQKGKRIRVVLKDGTVFVDKFVEATNKYSFFEKHGRILKQQIKAFSFYRHIIH